MSCRVSLFHFQHPQYTLLCAPSLSTPEFAGVASFIVSLELSGSSSARLDLDLLKKFENDFFKVGENRPKLPALDVLVDGEASVEDPSLLKASLSSGLIPINPK